MHDFYRIGLAALDHFELPVVRLDRNGLLVYMNHAARRLVGVGPDAGVDLAMLFRDPAQLQAVKRQLARRMSGEASAYEASFQRPGDRDGDPPVPLRIYAFPEVDDTGEVTGSLAMLRDLREERACSAIHQAIETVSDNNALLDLLAVEVARLIAHDELRITTVNAGRTHLRRLYSSDAQANARYRFRWWPMPPLIRQTLDDYSPCVIRMDELFAQAGYDELLEQDPDLRTYRDSGIRESQVLPILHDNRIVAFVALDARSDRRFDAGTVAQLGRLPVAAAVMAAVHREETAQHVAILELIRRMSTMAFDVRGAADEMVRCLAHEFGWDHASVFQVEDDPAAVRLVCQADGGLGLLPEQATLDAACVAAMAAASASAAPIVHSTARPHSPFAGTPGFDAGGSQLILPIRGRETRWVLNIESTLRNAFSQEEIALLEGVAQKAGEVMYRSSLFELQRAVLGAINDGVIETGRDGTLRWCNHAARQMLQIDLVDGPVRMADLVVGRDAIETIDGADTFSRREFSLRARTGALVPVLMSCSTLPKPLSGKVYVASDYTYQRELQRQGAMKEVFRHAAMEGRIPLSLAATWLGELDPSDSDLRATMDKVLNQLARADLPLERLLRLFSSSPEAERGMQSDVVRAIELTLREFPSNTNAAIERSTSCDTLSVAADFNQVQFCIESMLAFGLRTRPQSRKLHLSAACENGRAVVRVHGEWLPASGIEPETGTLERWRRKALYDLTLGKSVLHDVATRAGGAFRADFRSSLSMALELPLHQ